MTYQASDTPSGAPVNEGRDELAAANNSSPFQLASVKRLLLGHSEESDREMEEEPSAEIRRAPVSVPSATQASAENQRELAPVKLSGRARLRMWAQKLRLPGVSTE